jgi:hypothetical protein
MPTTILAGFEKLRQNLDVTGLQTATVSERQQNVRSVVEAGLTVNDSFLTGSYSRSTMISPLSESDIDVFIVLDVSYFHHYNNQNGGPAGLLDLVKRTLRSTYSRTPDVSRNGQAVTILFTDFAVDIIPAFYRLGGGFLIPNSITQTWIGTDPKRHVQIAAAANVQHNGDLIPLVKMIKAWNRTIDRHFSSFHLEVLTLAILNNVRISDFPSGMRFFFDKGLELIAQRNPDPAGYGADIGSYINTPGKIQVAVAKFQTAYERALKAEGLAAQGNICEAFDSWHRILGDYFPAYGQHFGADDFQSADGLAIGRFAHPMEYREMSAAGTATEQLARLTRRFNHHAESNDSAHYGYAAPSHV